MSSRVGGVVSETSFKFFIQFVVYTALFCGFALIVSAVFTAELKRNVCCSSPQPELFADCFFRLEALMHIGVYAWACECILLKYSNLPLTQYLGAPFSGSSLLA